MSSLTPNDRFVSLSPAAGTTVLAYDFELTRADGMRVVRIRGGAETVLQLGVDYAFPGGLGNPLGGTLTLMAASLAGDIFLLVGLHPEDRLSDFVASQKFSTSKINADLDALTMIAQEHRRDIDRAWKSAYGAAGKNLIALPVDHFWKSGANGNMVDGGSAADIENAQENAEISVAAAAEAEAARDVALGAVPNVFSPTRTALKALDTGTHNHAWFDESQWHTVPYAGVSSLVAADPTEGIYIRSTFDPMLVWVRQGSWAVYGVDAQWFGLVADYNPTLQTGAAIQSAVNAAFAVPVVKWVRLPAGNMLISDMISYGEGRKLSGAGRHLTRIYANDGFNLAADGWIKFTTSVQSGPELEDITFIAQDQPDSALLVSYVAYPPVIHAVDKPRCAVRRCRMIEVYDGIDMTGNSGGWVIDDLELCMFNVGIDINGSLDSTKISKLHIWPFAADLINALGTNKRTVFADAYGIRSGKNDDFKLSDSLIFSVRKGIYCFKGATAVDYTWGALTNVDFDDRGGIVIVNDGRLSFTGGVMSQGKADAQLVNMSGGTLSIDGVQFSQNIATSPAKNGMIEISNGASLRLGPGNTYGGSNVDQQFIYSANSTLIIHGGAAARAPGLAFVTAFVRATGTRGGIYGIFGNDLMAGSSILALVDTDSGFTIQGVQAEDWSLSTPNAALKNIITDNNVKSGGEKKARSGYFSADATTVVIMPTGWAVSKLGTGNYEITHGQGLVAATDMVITLTPDGTTDVTAKVDYAASTVNALRIRTMSAGVAADAALSFTAQLRKA